MRLGPSEDLTIKLKLFQFVWDLSRWTECMNSIRPVKNSKPFLKESLSCWPMLGKWVIITPVPKQVGWDHLHGWKSLMSEENNEKNKPSRIVTFYVGSPWTGKVNSPGFNLNHFSLVNEGFKKNCYKLIWTVFIGGELGTTCPLWKTMHFQCPQVKQG